MVFFYLEKLYSEFNLTNLQKEGLGLEYLQVLFSFNSIKTDFHSMLTAK